MKKYIPAVLLLLLSIILLFDCIALYPRVDWSPDASDRSGIGLYLFGGLLEINENITYCDTPEYFIGLCVVTAASFAIAAAAFFAGKRKTNNGI